MTPDQFTLKEKMIDVGQGHNLYAQLWGNAKADQTIIFLHGGPGSGCSDRHKTLFDPQHQRVIFFDQRGCGRSLPYGSLVDNDTDHLVEDINQVAKAFAANKFTLTGGSWGSCLALVYAIRFPQKVTRLVLRGIFTGRKKEIDFMDKGEFKNLFPEVWQDFVASAPAKFKDNPSAYHQPRALGKDKDAAKASAYAYTKLESAILSLDDREKPTDFETFDPVNNIIEIHYMANNCFLPEGYVMKNATKLTMPISLIQGRYDLICPPFTAFELARKLPNAELYWTIAGHSGNDRANWDLTKALLANG